MEELKDLREMAANAVARFDSYRGEDFVLPQVFKEQVTAINSSVIRYNKFSAIIETAGNQNGTLNIYLPNQWFFIASFFTDYYNELQRYKRVALSVTTKERLKVLNGGELSAGENQKIQSLHFSERSKSYLVRFITDYSWWDGAKTIDRGDFYVSPILSLAKLVNASQSFVADLCAFLADKQDLVHAIIDGETNTIDQLIGYQQSQTKLQQIFYGAPGTGKSYTINKQAQNEDVIRTTFHPDTDYSSFVGAYKPTTDLLPICNEMGQPIVVGSNTLYKEQIVYKFVEQAFLQAYIAAWKHYAEATEGTPKKQFLIIEEINRGNCAQIFGDLFQLLDRNEYGFSDYPITADADMAKQLQKAFAGLDIADKDRINSMYDNGKDVVKQVLDGNVLILPDNLYIWATMNTSDQSLFPIDSAFKRRWDWKYIPISDAGKGWFIEIGNEKYDWWGFLEKINTLIGATTNSEDKKLGYFFCKAKDGVISAETFVGKVIFYLWNDVFKDYEFADVAFNDIDGNKISFDKFYEAEGKETKVVEDKVSLFLHNLGLTPIVEDVEEVLDDDGNTEGNPAKDFSKYSLNGEGSYSKGGIVQEALKLYIEKHPQMTDSEVVNNWLSLGVNIPNLVETEEMHNERISVSRDSRVAEKSKQVSLADGHVIYVSNQFNVERITDFINKINATDWNINIVKL